MAMRPAHTSQGKGASRPIARNRREGGRSSSNVRRVTALLGVSSVVAFAAPAFAADDESDERRMQAQSLYDQGMKLEGTDPKAALVALRSSYEIQANYRVLHNIARVCQKLGDKECAVRSFGQYLKEGGTEIPAKRRKEIEHELKSLSRNATAIAVKSTVSGAFVKIDGSVVGRTPLPHPVPVSAGHHTVVLVADGNVIEKTVHVHAGASETVELEPKKDDPPAPAPVPIPAAPAPVEEAIAPPAPPAPVGTKAQPAPARPARSEGGVPVVPWIVAGTFAAATGVTGYLTASASSDYEALKTQYPVSRQELDDAHGKGRDLLLVTSVLGAATVVSVGVAAYFTFFRRSPAPQDKKVGVAVGPTGISIHGALP